MKQIEDMSQWEIVLYHIQKYGSMTDRSAVRYGIMRLGAVIHELRKKGYNIKTTMKSGKNKYKKAVTYGVYTLED